MSSVTVFLIVMIVALALGNGLFFLVKRKKRAPAEILQAVSAAASAPSDLSGADGFNYASLSAPGDDARVFTTAPMEKKIELAHARLQALESRVKSMQGIYEETFKGKIGKLEAFRDTANAEIIAIKEILEGMGKEYPLAKGRADAKPLPSSRQKGLSAEEVRRLIYRSQS